MAEYMQNWQDLHVRIQSQDLFSLINKVPASPRSTDFPFIYICDEPGSSPHLIYTALLDEIAAARNYIYVVTPYFFPPRPLRRALRDAALRGVNIKIIISHKTDVPLAVYLASSYFPEFRDCGMEILIYDKRINHAKYVIIDDNWATVGSTNFDHLSLIYNREGNLIIRDASLIAKIKALFEDEAARCKPADMKRTVAQHFLSPLINFLRSKL